MVAGSQARMASSPGFYLVVLSALIIWMVFGVIGSFIRARSSDQVDDHRGRDQLYGDYGYQDQDDDSYWFAGFYNNPNDRSLYASTSFVRRGLNLGNPVGLALMIVIILGFVALDILGILAAGS